MPLAKVSVWPFSFSQGGYLPCDFQKFSVQMQLPPIEASSESVML